MSGERRAESGVFRFENLEIWQRAADLDLPLFELADRLDSLKFFRFAEQLRAAALSITNNIAEGSGSDSNAEFKHFLNIARRSLFECASMLLIFQRKQLITAESAQPLLQELDELSRMITAFMKRLRTD